MPLSPLCIKNRKPGDHICGICEDDQEHKDILAAYLSEGLRRGEKILYIHIAHCPKTIFVNIRQIGEEIGDGISRGQVQLVRLPDVFQAAKESNAIGFERWLQVEERTAIQAGWTALRVLIDMAGLEPHASGIYRLIEAIGHINTFIAGSRCLVMSLFDRRSMEADLLVVILTSHPLVMIGTELYENFYFRPPRLLTGSDPMQAKLGSMLNNLKARRKIEEDLHWAYQELEQRIDRMQRITENSPAIIYFSKLYRRDQATVDIERVYTSPNIQQILGYEADACMHDPSWWKERIHPQDRFWSRIGR